MSDIQLEIHSKKTSVHTNTSSSVALLRVDPNNCRGNINLTSDAPMESGATLSFELGVPFELNHLNPVTQPSPLNEPDMFWTWRNGYKFLRIDMQTVSGTAVNGKAVSDGGTSPDSWAYHLGSVGCVSASAVRSPEKACAKPNLARFEVPVPQGKDFRLLFHVDVLMQDVTPTRANRCVMHGDKEPACDILFKNISEQHKPLFTLEAG